MRFLKRYTLLATVCACLGRRAAAGVCGRNLQFPLHEQPHQGAGRFRARLDPRGRRAGRWFGQTGDHRCQPGIQDLWKGRSTRSRWAHAAKPTTWASPMTASICGPAASTTTGFTCSTWARTPPSHGWSRPSRTCAAKTKFAGPHTFYALPGRMLIGNLSNTTDRGGVTGLALYNNKGTLIARYPHADGDARRGGR